MLTRFCFAGFAIAAFVLAVAGNPAPARATDDDRGTCTCTDNPRDVCDAGGYLHHIVDCHWSVDGGYCGYHDDVIARCDP